MYSIVHRAMQGLERELRVWQGLEHTNILQLLGLATLEANYNQPSLVTLWMPHGMLVGYFQACDCYLMLSDRPITRHRT